jgi:predicted nucleic acid-binding protein
LSVFVDTSAFYASSDDGDQAHGRARGLLASEGQLVTTDHVLAETWSLINVRGGHGPAEAFWGSVRRGPIAVETVLATDLDAAWAIGERFADQSFSLIDRTSFAVMERLGVHRAVTFDDDFAVYRFGPRRDSAFEVLR